MKLDNRFSALRITAICFGLLCGITGIVAGIFECLQGPLPTGGFRISAIGPTYSMWQDQTYRAYSVFSDFLTAGSFTILVSTVVCIWSVTLIHKRIGSWGFLVLSVLQLLFGGAFVIDLAIITFFVASGIQKPLKWWRRNLPFRIRSFLMAAWTWSVVIYIMISVALLLITLCGIDNGAILEKIVPLAGIMFIPMVFMVFGGIAADINIRMDNSRSHSV